MNNSCHTDVLQRQRRLGQRRFRARAVGRQALTRPWEEFKFPLAEKDVTKILKVVETISCQPFTA